MTNVTEDFLFAALEESGLTHFKAEINGSEIRGFFETYARAGSDPFMLIGSHGNIEIAINRDSAASLFRAKIGQKIHITFDSVSNKDSKKK